MRYPSQSDLESFFFLERQLEAARPFFTRDHDAGSTRILVLHFVKADRSRKGLGFAGVWDQIDEGDTISITGLSGLAPNTPVACVLHKTDGSAVEFSANHTLSPEQIEWFHAGSALNLIRQQTAGS